MVAVLEVTVPQRELRVLHPVQDTRYVVWQPRESVSGEVVGINSFKRPSGDIARRISARKPEDVRKPGL